MVEHASAEFGAFIDIHDVPDPELADKTEGARSLSDAAMRSGPRFSRWSARLPSSSVRDPYLRERIRRQAGPSRRVVKGTGWAIRMTAP